MALNWLHISDLHMGLPGQKHLWPNVEREFYRDLQAYCSKSGPVDVVFFTGDLVQSGHSDEFQHLSGLLDRLWSQFASLGPRPNLITIPGNHDLQRPSNSKAKPASSSLRVLLRWKDLPEVHDELWLPGNEYQQVIVQAFENYTKWCRDELPKYQDPNAVSTTPGVIPGDFSATVTVRDRKIGVVGLNSAFLQLDQGDFVDRLALYMAQLHAVCPDILAWEQTHHLRFLLTHHPVNWLNSQVVTQQWPEIAPSGRFDFHLFGHMHENHSIDESVDGGPIRRSWQGSSLFGTEHYLARDGSVQLRREHGYQFGQVEFVSEQEARARQFPRKATLHEKNGWSIQGDPRFGRLSDDGGTPFKRIELQTANVPIHTFPISAATVPPPVKAKAKAKAKAADQTLDQILPGYVEIINKTHGFIRFVEIPHLQDLSDVAIAQLYVSPEVSTQQIHCDWPVNRWGDRLDILELLSRNKKVVLLGDPGFGKSTLISYLSWLLCNSQQFTTPGASTTGNRSNVHRKRFLEELSSFVPIPIILREMQLQADLTWESLVESFVANQALGRQLQKRENFNLLLSQGRALVMLDGIDEISNITVRSRLRTAIIAGMAAYPLARWILTSRIVGYNEVPFDVIPEDEPTSSVAAMAATQKSGKTETAPRRAKGHAPTRKVCERYYLAPFSNEKIAEFSASWFARHENSTETVKETTAEFFNSIAKNDGTKRLARVPFLLTLMSLLYHKSARLPHGRAELYERIAAAYLESIDTKRKLTNLPYSLTQKKQWLSYIGFQMQARRASNRNSQYGASDILASKRLVKDWLIKAITEVGAPKPRREAENLLDYFAERSGLFLPRGLNKFAFAHLSLQEYFAACYLEPKLAASRFTVEADVDGPTETELFAWANKSAWRETFALLFEILAERGSKQTEAFLQFLFSEERLLPGPAAQDQQVAVHLLAEVVVDPFNSITVGVRSLMKKRCWKWLFHTGRATLDSYEFDHTNDVAAAAIAETLLSEHKSDLRSAWDSAGILREDLKGILGLRFDGCANLVDLTPLSDVRSLQCLSLERCGRVSDLQALTRLKDLRGLNLWGCDDALDIAVISQLTQMCDLKISVRSTANSLLPVKRLSKLTSLRLRCIDGSVDLGPLKGLGSLQVLILDDVSDVVTLRSMIHLQSLREIHIHGCPLELDLAFLGELRELKHVCNSGSDLLKVPAPWDLPF